MANGNRAFFKTSLRVLKVTAKKALQINNLRLKTVLFFVFLILTAFPICSIICLKHANRTCALDTNIKTIYNIKIKQKGVNYNGIVR